MTQVGLRLNQKVWGESRIKMLGTKGRLWKQVMRLGDEP